MKRHKWFAVLAAMALVFTAFGCKTEIKTEYVDKTYCSAVTFTSEATEDGVKVTMETSTEGAAIYYTTDGTVPTEKSTKYSEPVEFTTDVTVKAIAVKTGIENSPVSVATVSIKEKTITEIKTEYVDKNYCSAVNFTSQATEDGVKVSMATSTEGAAIYYTTDGTIPTKRSTKYSEPVEFTTDVTVKAIAVKTGIENSPVSVATVSIKEKTITETKIEYVDKIYCSAVTFTSQATEDGVKVTMATATEGAAIYYTTDGTAPTAESTKYSEPIEFTTDVTIKAIAIKTGIENSPVSVATVSIKENSLEIDTSAPAEVTEFTVVNQDASALLTWKDPADGDLFGIEITYSENTSSRHASAMEEKSVLIAPKTQNAVITGLTNGTEYTFTVKSMDLTGNKSAGVTKILTPAIIEKTPLEVTLTASTTEKTNGNVTVSVSAVTDSASAVKKIAYKTGTVADVADVLNGTDITETKTFTVTENGSYTVAATDTAGRRELRWITVSNIDKTAPAPVTALEIGYDYGNKTVTISWKDPADSDFANAELTYTLGDAGAVTVPVAKGKQTYAIENIEPDVKVTASVKAVDDVNNESTAVNAETTTTKSFAIRSITLSRDHVEYKSGKQITATIKGDNFDLLPTGDDALTVKVYDGTTLVTSCTTVAEVDTVNNTATATATFTAPDGTDDIEGKTYTVEAVVNLEKTGIKESLRVSKEPSLYDYRAINIYDKSGNEVSAIFVNDVTAETTVKATVKAYNFDIADEIKLAFFDSKGNEVSGASKVVTEEDFVFNNTTSYETFSVNVPVPQNEGFYTLKAMWDGTIISSSYYKTLQIYGVPKFTSFKIPNAGTAAAGNQLTATFYGLNFTAPDVDTRLFEVSCDAKKTIVVDSSVTVTDDTTATVLLTIPDTAGTYTVTLTYGSSSITADFVVKDYSSLNYKVGDVMLSDGTKVDYAESQTFTEDQKSKAVAVIFGFRNGVPLGVGLNNSQSGTNRGKKVWASDGTTGYNTKFTGIICTPSVTGSVAAATATFTGDTDGSDNWDYICSVDPEGTAAPAANYPAFNYVLNYASTFKLPDGYKDGWYMPSIAELAEMYKNKDVVNSVLSAIGGTQIYSGYYWSSSQLSSGYAYAWRLSFSAGYLDYYFKDNNDYVCCVRAF